MLMLPTRYGLPILPPQIVSISLTENFQKDFSSWRTVVHNGTYQAADEHPPQVEDAHPSV